MIETDDRLTPDARPAKLDDLFTDPAYHDAVLCTHGETIEALLSRWKEHRLVKLPLKRKEISKDATGKGGSWLVINEGDGWAAHYLRPLHVGPVIDDTDSSSSDSSSNGSSSNGGSTTDSMDALKVPVPTMRPGSR